MARNHAKQPAEEKKESSKKRATKSVKKLEATVWPCKINGCNKEFAREADLKRHQRTTKLHATPEQQPVGCPQCDATFTRIDALRRHQKSRHNGVILDPVIPPPNRQGEVLEDSNASGSRSGTPNKAKGEGGSVALRNGTSAEPVPMMLVHPDPPGQIGSTSYYRQHTIHPVFVPPRTPHGVLHEPHLQQPQIPTSAARFNGHIAYVSAPPPGSYYPPGAYYRTPDGHPIGSMQIPHLAPPLPPGSVTMQVNPTPAVATQSSQVHPKSDRNESEPSAQTDIAPIVNNERSLVHSEHDTKPVGENSNPHVTNRVSFTDVAGISAAVQKALEAVLAIDPSLTSLNETVQQILPQAVLATQNALKASEASERPTDTTAQEQPTGSEVTCSKLSMKVGENDVDADGEADPDNNSSAGQISSVTMMTEDGVAMLRPDELLNEETLSYPSPPP